MKRIQHNGRVTRTETLLSDDENGFVVLLKWTSHFVTAVEYTLDDDEVTYSAEARDSLAGFADMYREMTNTGRYDRFGDRAESQP
jgi:galactose mutarotase-like enzyme